MDTRTTPRVAHAWGTTDESRTEQCADVTRLNDRQTLLKTALARVWSPEIAKLIGWLEQKGYLSWPGSGTLDFAAVPEHEQREILIEGFPGLPEKRRSQILRALATRLRSAGYTQEAERLNRWQQVLVARIHFHDELIGFLAHALRCMPARPDIPEELSALTLDRIELLSDVKKMHLLTRLGDFLCALQQPELSREAARLITELRKLTA